MLTDKGALTLLVASPAAAASMSWVDTATGFVEFAVAIASLIGLIWAALYHYERWTKLRKQRKEKK
jgi:hypothetical protein